MSDSLIAPDAYFAVIGALFIIVSSGLLLERFSLGQKVSAAMLSIAMGMVLSNFGILPYSSAVYDFIIQYLVPVAIPLLLFKSNLRGIWARGGATLLAFCLGAAGTVLGAFVAYLVLDVGVDASQVTGIFTGGFIGGGVNFVAISRAIGFDDPSRLSAMLAADSIVTVPYLLLLASLPSSLLVRRFLPVQEVAVQEDQAHVESVEQDAASIRVVDITLGLGLSLLICALCFGFSDFIGVPEVGILLITAVAVLLGNVAPARLAKLRGDSDIGMLLMYLFFAVLGASTNIGILLGSAIWLVLFVVIIIGVHFAVVVLGGKLLGLGYPEIITGSNACVLGPPTAAAIAANQGWKHLIAPGILCGVFGYVIATFVGVTLSSLLP